jgi:hypothetical protein
MGVFNNEDVVFGRMKAGQNLTTHVYHEPNFQNNTANELHPIFNVLAIVAGILFLVSLCGLDYRGVMLLGIGCYVVLIIRCFSCWVYVCVVLPNKDSNYNDIDNSLYLWVDSFVDSGDSVALLL